MATAAEIMASFMATKPTRNRSPQGQEPVSTKLKYYVLACDTQRNKAMRAEIIRRSKIANVHLSRVIIATHKEEVLRADGKLVLQNVQSFPGYLIIRCEMTDDHLNFFDKLKTEGVVVTRTYDKVVKEKGRSRIGYNDDRLVVNDGEAEETEFCIGSNRCYVIGLLPLKPTFTKKIPGKNGAVRARPPKELRPKMRPDAGSEWGFSYVRDKETGDIIMVPHDEIKAVEAWHPIALDTLEAAEILLRGQQTKKPKVSPYIHAKPGPAIGDRVLVKEGVFMNAEGTVVKIDGSDYTIELSLMGRTTKIKANKLQLEKVL